MKLKDQSSPVFSPIVLSDVAFDPKTASALFIISTDSRDRDGDIMKPEGCLETLHTYKANPTVLFDHGETEKMPIGMSEYPDTNQCTIEVEPNRIRGRVFFHCETLVSSQVARLTEKKVLRAASIGYKGIDADPIDPRRPRGGMIYHQWELVEWSIVPVPSNQDALLQALGARWEGKALAEPIAMRFKSLLRPSKKLILPATIQSTRKKAMPDETIDTPADETSQLPAGAQGIQLAISGITAALASVKEVFPTIEQPQAIKLLEKFISDNEKAMAALSSKAAAIYPDVFEAGDTEADEVVPDAEDDSDEEAEVAAETGKEDDVSNVSSSEAETDKEKSLKKKRLCSVCLGTGQDVYGSTCGGCNGTGKIGKDKSYGEVDSGIHVETINDVTELLEDMSKSANIPSGYKRQCKGVLPGLSNIKSFFGKSKDDTVGAEESPEPETKADEEDEEKNTAAILKALQDVSKKADANAASLATLKGK